MAITDQALLEEIQYHTLEPPDLGLTWTTSGVWTQAEVLGYATQRQHRLLRQTLLLVGIAAPIPIPAGTLRFDLPDDWVRTVRMVWRAADGSLIRALARSDSFDADHQLPTWMGTQGKPLVYMDEETPTLVAQIAPAPDVDGFIDLDYIPLATPLTLDPEILTVPDEEAHALKYGTMADMLRKDGPARDTRRADYCQMRFDLGVEAANLILKGWA